MKSNKYIKCGVLIMAFSSMMQSCTQCDALTAAAVASGAVAMIPGVDSDTRRAAAIASPVLGYFAFNCYQATERQKRQAEARARQLQKRYVSNGGEAKGAQRYYAVPVSREKGVERKFQVKEGVATKDVILVDAKEAKIMDPAAYEIQTAKKSLEANGKSITVDA